MDETLVFILIAIGAVIILGLVVMVFFSLLCFAVTGAASLFVVAASQGFIGFILYIAAWVFMFPVMVVICILFGLIVSAAGAASGDGEAVRSKTRLKIADVRKPPADPFERYKWANRLPPYEDDD